MEFVTGLKDSKVKTLEELEREESVGTEVTAEGMVHSIRSRSDSHRHRTRRMPPRYHPHNLNDALRENRSASVYRERIQGIIHEYLNLS